MSRRKRARRMISDSAISIVADAEGASKSARASASFTRSTVIVAFSRELALHHLVALLQMRRHLVRARGDVLLRRDHCAHDGIRLRRERQIDRRFRERERRLRKAY